MLPPSTSKDVPMTRRFCRFLLFVLLTAKLGLFASGAVADGFHDKVRPFITRYCIDCHSTAEKTADIDLERFASAADVAAEPGPWQLVADQLLAQGLGQLDVHSIHPSGILLGPPHTMTSTPLK